MLKVMIGHDTRIPIQTNVAANSVYRHSTAPVSITPLVLSQLPIKRRGLTEFSFARFLTPWLAGFDGPALFIDSDVIVRSDVAELFALFDPKYAVQVCDIHPQFEQTAVMLFNCGHPDNKMLTPEFIGTTDKHLHLLGWTNCGGHLPMNWNHCAGYARRQPLERLHLVHYTMGSPIWPHTADCEHASAWHDERKNMCYVGVSWPDLMGQSVHAARDHSGNLVPKYRLEVALGTRRNQGGAQDIG
jgi:hypothetical protein